MPDVFSYASISLSVNAIGWFLFMFDLDRRVQQLAYNLVPAPGSESNSSGSVFLSIESKLFGTIPNSSPRLGSNAAAVAVAASSSLLLDPEDEELLRSEPRLRPRPLPRPRPRPLPPRPLLRLLLLLLPLFILLLLFLLPPLKLNSSSEESSDNFTAVVSGLSLGNGIPAAAAAATAAAAASPVGGFATCAVGFKGALDAPRFAVGFKGALDAPSKHISCIVSLEIFVISS